tara:strand:- start:2906 stop:3127 length:222 start_codon:yes stop_codon:yes gene_type:complete
MNKETIEIETVDLTPTWEYAARIYTMAMINGTDEGKREATEELVKMGKLVDDLQKKLKEWELFEKSEARANEI